MSFLKEVKQNKGYKSQLQRIFYFTIITFFILPGFFTLFLGYYNITPMFTVNGSMYQLFGLFTIILILTQLRISLKENPYHRVPPIERLTFALFAYLVFSSYLFLRFLYPVTLDTIGMRIIITYILYLLGVLFVALSTLGSKFFKENSKEISIAIILLAIFAVVSTILQNLWIYFSKGVLWSTYFILNLFFNGVSTPGEIGLRLYDFNVVIGSPCSGIVSLGLFSSLFVLFCAYEWKRLNKNRIIPFYIIGALGMYFMNILRITTLMIIGAFYSKSFAIKGFHENIGWINFIIYFIILIPIAYKFFIKKKD